MEYYHVWRMSNRTVAESVEYYVMHGLEPGSFTTAVLANDLFDATARADHWNKKLLPEIALAIRETCPLEAYGSYDNVRNWIDDKDGRRSRYSTWKKLQGPVENPEPKEW